MTQLIINGTSYPKTSNDKYKVYKTELSESVRMAAGNLVYEVRGKYTIIEYSYDYFPTEIAAKCIADLRSGEELTVSYLVPYETEMPTQTFRCTKMPEPVFAFGRGNTAYWHDFSFTLEAVECDS